jgi:hypothetical protein
MIVSSLFDRDLARPQVKLGPNMTILEELKGPNMTILEELKS